MPAFALDNAEMAGIIAYIRNMNAVDVSTVKTGDAARGRVLFAGKGDCASCHRVGADRVARGAEPERHRRRAQPRLAAALAPRPDQPDDADQPPVRVVTKDGTVINGRRLNEDTYACRSSTTASACTRLSRRTFASSPS